MTQFINKNNYLLILFFLGLLVLFANLGRVPLLDPDEPVYAETAKEMHIFGDFLSPRIYGEYWYDKPPMYYWLVASAQFIFGENEFAARFPSALMAFASIFLLFFTIRKLIDEKTAFVSSLILLTSMEFFYLAKGAVTDTTLTFFITLSLCGFLLKKYYVWYIGAALAVVTKGPVGVFFPAIIVLIFLIFRRNIRELGKVKLFKGIIIFFLVASPWYILMYLKHGFVFLDTFLGFHNIIRFTSAEHPETNKILFYVFVLLAGFFPWVVILPQSVILACKKIYASNLVYNDYDKSVSSTLLFCLIWAITVFLFFTAAQTKLVSYILPMFPPMAILVAYYLKDLESKYSKIQYILWGILFATVTLLIDVSVLYIADVQDKMFCNYVYMSIIISVACITFVFFILRQKILCSIYTNVIMMSLFAVLLNTSFLQPVIADYSMKPTADDFLTIYNGESDIYVMKFLRPGFAYYSGKYGMEILKSDSLHELVERPGAFYIIMTDTDLKKSNLNLLAPQFVPVLARDNKIVFYKNF